MSETAPVHAVYLECTQPGHDKMYRVYEMPELVATSYAARGCKPKLSLRFTHNAYGVFNDVLRKRRARGYEQVAELDFRVPVNDERRPAVSLDDAFEDAWARRFQPAVAELSAATAAPTGQQALVFLPDFFPARGKKVGGLRDSRPWGSQLASMLTAYRVTQRRVTLAVTDGAVAQWAGWNVPKAKYAPVPPVSDPGHLLEVLDTLIGVDANPDLAGLVEVACAALL